MASVIGLAFRLICRLVQCDFVCMVLETYLCHKKKFYLIQSDERDLNLRMDVQSIRPSPSPSLNFVYIPQNKSKMRLKCTKKCQLCTWSSLPFSGCLTIIKQNISTNAKYRMFTFCSRTLWRNLI